MKTLLFFVVLMFSNSLYIKRWAYRKKQTNKTYQVSLYHV